MTYTSTIDDTIPEAGSELASALIRANFAAAQDDINVIAALADKGSVLDTAYITDYVCIVRDGVNYLVTVAALLGAATPITTQDGTPITTQDGTEITE